LAWARTYLGKAGLVEAPRRGLVTITDAGQRLIATDPAEINRDTLAAYPQFMEWVSAGNISGADNSRPTSDGTEGVPPVGKLTGDLVRTPLERIDQANLELDGALKSDLLARVRTMTPADFERLIIRLLLGMGYGQGLEELARAVGGSGDGGIDGVINQDPLGLDRVYIQAKQWKEGSGVSSPEIRNFVGALNIHRANKGVFVTASHFTAEASRAAQGSTVQVVLIDGGRLAELMSRYKVGVIVRDVIELKEIDEGFFDL
jgi:restriction system protein